MKNNELLSSIENKDLKRAIELKENETNVNEKHVLRNIEVMEDV